MADALLRVGPGQMTKALLRVGLRKLTKALFRLEPGEMTDALLRVGHRRAAVHHGPGELEHRVPVARLVLEPAGEAAALDVLEHVAEAVRHRFAVHLER